MNDGMKLTRNAASRMFLELFVESRTLKDQGLLHSSLMKRLEATRLAETLGNPALRAIGKANEATLLGYHIGDGIAAFAAAKEALSDVELFATADKEWRGATGLTLFEDMLKIIRQWSDSYDEFMMNTRRHAKYFPKETTGKDIVELEEARREMPEWWKCQIVLAHQHFSRDSPELDKGAYAPGMSVLQCVLSRALAEKTGYDVDYGFFEHTLDDYVVISLRNFEKALAKYQAVHGAATNPSDHRELSIILDEPLRIWQAFMPEMREADKEKFSEFLQMYWLRLAMLHAQDKTSPLGAYFPGAFMPCPHCGRQIARQSPICRYCGKMNGSFAFPKGVQGPPAGAKKNTRRALVSLVVGIFIIAVIIIVLIRLFAN